MTVEQILKKQLVIEAKHFLTYVRRGAGHNANGEFNITALRDAIENGVSLEEIGVTPERVTELEKMVVGQNLKVAPSRVSEFRHWAECTVLRQELAEIFPNA